MNKDWCYPRFLRRLQAVLFDSILLAIVFLSILIIAEKYGITGRESIVLTGVIVLLWEPVLVSFTGGTIGHHLIGLRVVSTLTGKNLNFFASIIRSITKMLFGQFSVVFIFITRYHQAIHDGLAKSVVVLKYPETKPDYEVLSPRPVELDGYKYPSVLLRSMMIVFYNAALIFLIGTITGLLLPAQCLLNNGCTLWQGLALIFWQLFWFVGVVVIIVLCWKGRLFGCRRKIIKGNQNEN